MIKETYAMPNETVEYSPMNSRPKMLFVTYVSDGHEVTITIHGLENPLPFKKMKVRVPFNDGNGTSLYKWLISKGWLLIGTETI